MNIDFKQVFDIATIGIRRAAVFMGLGINAANNPACNDYHLGDESYINLVPRGQSGTFQR